MPGSSARLICVGLERCWWYYTSNWARSLRGPLTCLLVGDLASMQTNKQKQKRSAISENPSGTRPDSNRMLLAGGQRENMIFILCECVNQVHHMSVPILIHAFLSSVLCRFLCELETEWCHANILAPLTQSSRPDAIKKTRPCSY